MNKETRSKFILKQLDKAESISLKEITAKFNVSEITARRDLASLESRGLLIRTHGGAIRTSNVANLFSFEKKLIENGDKKDAICRLASTFVEENDTIYMDCGTTVYYMAKYLTGFRNLRVITNSLPVVSELIHFINIKVYLIGGELDNESKALYGPMTDNLISRYKADKAFIGAGGVSLEHGLSSANEKNASVTIKMAEAARKVFLLVDSTKIEQDSYFTYSGLSLITYLITDKSVPTDLIDKYRSRNINIITT
ncbi:MAG: DeoR/GlpR family DNA-binding transcription regulator [Bacteroidales bacterium]